MNRRAYALWLACAAQALALHLPAAAQGLRAPGQLLPRAADTGPRAADYIVAVVNSEPITNNEVRSRMARFEQQLAQQGQGVPPRAEFARQVLERLISEKAQLQLARENGIKIGDAQVDQAEQNVARSNQMTVAEFRKRLEAEGMSTSTFREELREQLTLQRLREREFDNRTRVSELEIDQYLREQEQASADPSRQEFNLGHILVVVPERATDAQVAEAQARAQRLLQRARGGEDFAKLAQEFPQGREIGANGLPVGARSLDRLPPLFVQAVQNVPEGGISELVRSGAGFHVVKVYERRKGGMPGASVTQSHARHILLRPGPQLSENQAVQRIAEFKRRIQSGNADFAQVAREFSQDASARNGGDLGWANPGLYVPEFEEVMNALAPGQLSDPLISRYGVHLIQLLERRQATLSAKEQREVARSLVREKKIDEAYTTWAQEVRGRAWVEYREPPR
ncbi:peptidylprolyl isomerase [Ramlibacter solisilvae]|uniref:Chaperone SurA n=1 Tax=Ramlibacter tataouinensis TaxID=94132 RepID=A0A127JYJ9_9BURK|nr:peptidylprolyl isomerase [Ramlibacter tataouinensis]AMO23182.1 molecular chaperone SurA [Ramlibacter tataouinensis]